jgi:hypothetical protein
MRYCFDFQSFGGSIRFMVADEAPQMAAYIHICAKTSALRNHPRHLKIFVSQISMYGGEEGCAGSRVQLYGQKPTATYSGCNCVSRGGGAPRPPHLKVANFGPANAGMG